MISIIIPMYNEEDNAEQAVSEIEKVMKNVNSKYEILAINDGSKDKTLEKLNLIKKFHKKLKVFSYKNNKGPGAAFRTGFKNAKGDIILTVDCDLSFSPEDIPKLISEIKNYDVVIGSQHMKGAGLKNVPLIRVLASKVAVFLDKKILGVKLTSLSSFFVAYKKNVIKKIKFEANGFDAQCEILTKIYRGSYKIKEIPCALKWSNKRKKRGISLNKLLLEVKRRFYLWKRLNSN